MRAISALEAELRRRTRALLAGLTRGEHIDFALRVAREIPTQAICIVLGVPEEDRLTLADWIDHGIAAPSDEVIAEEYVRKVRRYAQGLIEAKRAAPHPDIFSTIVHARFAANSSTLSGSRTALILRSVVSGRRRNHHARHQRRSFEFHAGHARAMGAPARTIPH